MTGIRWDERGEVGFYPVDPGGVYDDAYFEEYVRRAGTPVGLALNEARVALVRKWAGDGSVVDVGVGAGAFILAHGPRTRGYDVNPRAIRWLLDCGLWWDPYQADPDNATFWDSLEHIERPEALLARVRFHAFVSIPIFEGPDHAARSKHFKPREHYWYFTRNGFVRFMESCGFCLLEENRMETELGREDIGTFAFRRSP